jgi:hypothetical protein
VPEAEAVVVVEVLLYSQGNQAIHQVNQEVKHNK